MLAVLLRLLVALLHLLDLAVGANLLQALALPPLALFLNQLLALALLLGVDDIAHGSRGAEKVGVVCVDIGTLDRNQRLNVGGRGAESLAKQVRDSLDKLGL